ncbi:MAG: ABC transporter ATP-binding protein, partial [Deltaproteobacteria bacterium]|nr:ABC transporter ATP-binding protein [Deltaproteobacteria bacterium]
LADRIALLDRGRLVQVGPPRALYDEPARSEVATFFGAREGLAGTREPGGVRIGNVVVPAWAVEDAPASGPVRLAFRASDAHLAEQGIPAVVEDAAWRGHSERLVLRVGDERVVVEGGGTGRPGELVRFVPRRAFALPAGS